MATERDFVRTIEATYQVHRPLRGWLGGVLESARPWLDQGIGVFGYAWEVVEGGVVSFIEHVALGSPGIDLVRLAGEIPAEIGRMGAEVLQSNQCGLSSRVLKRPEIFDFYMAPLRAMGIADAIGINGLDSPKSGIWMGAYLPRARSLARGEERLYRRIARHLAAGNRLRRRLGPRPPTDEEADAILSPEGRLEHAAPTACSAQVRTALRQAVLAMDRARGAERRTDPEGAVRRWQVLADSRYTLMDRFESNGRRYVVACENQLDTAQHPRLTPRERQVVALYRLGSDSKMIAYELGLADATVRVLLSRAARRLGVGRPRALRDTGEG
jgi:DNA-binding CsgD family transcriptional regulator